MKSLFLASLSVALALLACSNESVLSGSDKKSSGTTAGKKPSGDVGKDDDDGSGKGDDDDDSGSGSTAKRSSGSSASKDDDDSDTTAGGIVTEPTVAPTPGGGTDAAQPDAAPPPPADPRKDIVAQLKPAAQASGTVLCVFASASVNFIGTHTGFARAKSAGFYHYFMDTRGKGRLIANGDGNSPYYAEAANGTWRWFAGVDQPRILYNGAPGGISGMTAFATLFPAAREYQGMLPAEYVGKPDVLKAQWDVVMVEVHPGNTTAGDGPAIATLKSYVEDHGGAVYLSSEYSVGGGGLIDAVTTPFGFTFSASSQSLTYKGVPLQWLGEPETDIAVRDCDGDMLPK